MFSFDTNDKKNIFNYINSKIDLLQYKYKLMEYMDELEVFRKEKYYASINYLGINNLLIFVRINDKYYSVLIDKKSIPRPNINFNDILMFPFNMRFNKSIYDGTILDGILLINKATKKKVFMLTDIYYLKGNDLRNDNLKNKLLNFSVYLKNAPNNDNDNYSIEINKIYNFSEFNKLDDDMNKASYYEHKGYAFYPEISGKKLVLLNNNIDTPINKNMFNKNVITKPDEINIDKSNIPEFNNVKNTTTITIKYYPKIDDDIFVTLEMRKTVYTEVYTLHYLIIDIVNGLKVFKIKSLGNAYIPDQLCSQMCKTIIGSKKNGKALMKCKFNRDKNKWIPIHEDNTLKIPNTLQEIEKFIDIFFEEEEEQ